jgi:hypothetical protein
MNFVRLSTRFSAPHQRQRKAVNRIGREGLNGEMSQELQASHLGEKSLLDDTGKPFQKAQWIRPDIDVDIWNLAARRSAEFR